MGDEGLGMLWVSLIVGVCRWGFGLLVLGSNLVISGVEFSPSN